MARRAFGLPSGAPVGATDGVADSYLSAQGVLKGMAMDARKTRIIDSADRGMHMGTRLMGLDVVPIFEKLRYASSQETEEILRDHFDAVGTVARQSVVMENYLYIDVLLAAMRGVIRENGGDPNKIIPEAVKQQAGDGGLFRRRPGYGESARKVLLTAIRFRGQARAFRASGK